MSSQKIYAIVRLDRENCGHGDTSPIAKLATKEAYSVVPHPVFRTRHNAEEYLAKWAKEHYFKHSIMELELI